MSSMFVVVTRASGERKGCVRSGGNAILWNYHFKKIQTCYAQYSIAITLGLLIYKL